jgi:hypothetical protein
LLLWFWLPGVNLNRSEQGVNKPQEAFHARYHRSVCGIFGLSVGHGWRNAVQRRFMAKRTDVWGAEIALLKVNPSFTTSG